MSVRRRLAVKLAAAFVFVARTVVAGVSASCFDELPVGWSVESSFLVSEQQTAEIAKRLGVPVARLSNTCINVNGRRIQVNVVEADSESDASQLYQAIAKRKPHPAFCVRKDLSVVEYVGDATVGADLATRVSWELGFVPKPKEVRYRVTAKLAAVQEVDYMRLNKLYNLFLQADSEAGGEADAEIADTTRHFRFGNRLTLRAPSGKRSGVAEYRFTPEPVGKTCSGGTVTYEFESLPRSHGIPYTIVTAEVVATAERTPPAPAEGDDDALLSPTPFWPADDLQIKSLAEDITRGCEDNDEKVNAILTWLTPGKHIGFGGPVAGSRYGVEQVLKQRFGYCWDFADCFVTLCRASGIACREVGGWCYGAEGHIWAEILLEDRGWLQVDPTGGGRIECGIYHIAYFASEDGEMGVLYLSMPIVEIIDLQP